MRYQNNVGPRMLSVAWYVNSHPGCTKRQVARNVGYSTSEHYGYQAVNRAIHAGLIRAERNGQSYALYYNTKRGQS